MIDSLTSSTVDATSVKETIEGNVVYLVVDMAKKGGLCDRPARREQR